MRNLKWKVLLTLVIGAGIATPATLTFSKTQLSTGASFFGNTQAVATADLNGDGIPDLVAVTQGGPSNPQVVVVRLGNGDGTFQAGKVYPEGGISPQMVVIADFNGDGFPDIAIPNGGGDISVLPGNGDGTFHAGLPRQLVGVPCGWMAAADFNRDGNVDLVLTFPTSAKVGVMLGNGDGTFVAPVFYTVGIQPTWVGAIDMNHDGRPDLVVTDNGTRQMSLLLGNGDGTFGSAATYVAGQGALSAAIADFNGDGNPDIATAGGPQGGVGILLGRGDGTFQPLTIYNVGTSPSSIVAADFDGDGKIDLAVIDTKASEANAVAILLGNGDGSFQKTPLYFDVLMPTSMTMADLNQDGRPDLAITNVFGDDQVDLAVLINTTSAVTSVSAASFQSGPLAPDMIVSGFGSHLATVTQGASSSLTTDLGNTTVVIKDSAGVQQLCAEYFVSDGQVNYYLPGTTALGTATVTVTASDGIVSTGKVQVAAVSPGIFTLNPTGLAAALVLRVKPDGSQDIEQVYQLDFSKNVIPLPIDLGAETDKVYLELFGTGIRHANSLANVSLTVVGKAPPNVPVLYAGAQPSFVGEDQVNIGPLPRTLIGAGSINLLLTVDQINANTVNVTIK